MRNLFGSILLFILALLTSVEHLYAQDPLAYHLNDENGLPSNEVYQVIQDKFGYIWIGCDAGLYRYDGFSFKQFKNSEQNGFSIADLKLDAKGRVWSRNFKGQIYCVSENKLLNVTKGIKANNAHALYALDSKSCCWTIIEGTLYQINAFGKVLFSKKLTYQSKPIKVINSIAIQHNKLYFSDQTNSIYIYTISNQSIHKMKRSSVRTEKNTFFKKENELYLMSEETETNSVSIFKVKESTCQLTNSFLLSAKNTRVYGIYHDNKHKSWICTANGVAPYSSNINSLDEISCFQKGENISSFLEDKEGNIWLTSLQNGIFIIPNLKLVNYKNANSNAPEDNLTALKSINSTEMLIGAYSGKVYLFNSKLKTFQEINTNTPIKKTSVKFIYNYKDSYFVSHGPLSEIKNNKLKCSYPIYNAKEISIAQNKLYFILSDINGVANLNDLKEQSSYVFDEHGGRGIQFNPYDKTFYYALNEGLFTYKNGKWREIKNKGRSIHSTGMVLYNNQLCVASVSQGLFFISHSHITKQLHAENSKLDNEIRCITSNSNYIWVCSTTSLYRISKDCISEFSTSSGINTRDVNSICTHQENVYFATNRGLIEFPENSNFFNRNQPSIRINRIVRDGQSFQLHEIALLPFNNSQLIFEMSSISFSSKGNYTYDYRLIGADKSWTTVPASSNFIRYNTIPPGKYEFQIKAINENGISSKTIRFRFEVASPLWQKWWFYLLISILTIGICGLLFYYRIQFIQRKADQLNKLTSSQLTALKAQMNPHFMFNALNSIQELVLLNDTKNSNLYLGKFSHLMRKILDASDKDIIPLQSELELLKLYLELEQLRFKKDFTFSIESTDEVDPYAVTIPSMILQPFVENALKHGLLHKKGSKKLSVSFSIENENLTCVIEDNGIGRKHAQAIKMRQSTANTSFATQATEKRIDLLNRFTKENYTFEVIDLVQNEKEIGTKVVITLPIS